MPVLALGGEKSLGAAMGGMMAMVAERADGGVLPGCGHFIPEEQPDELVRRLAAFAPGIRRCGSW